MEFYMAFAMSIADELGQFGYDLTIISDARDTSTVGRQFRRDR